MELQLKRPLLFFDIESTGLNVSVDCIIELGFVKVFPDGEERIKTWRIKPWDYANERQYPIDPAAGKVHGIKDEDLTGNPTFCEIAGEVAEWLKDSDLAGFSSSKFDLPILAEEFERVKLFRGISYDIDFHSPKMIDVQVIYHLLEPRNLKAAYRFYCGGEDYDNAHSSEADAVATYKVLKAQLDRYPEQLRNDVNQLASFTGRKYVDFSGHIIRNDNGEPVVNFGKHKGKTVRDVFRTERSFFGWIAQGAFPLDTKAQFARLWNEYQKEYSEKSSAYNEELKKRPATQDELKNLQAKFGKLP